MTTTALARQNLSVNVSNQTPLAWEVKTYGDAKNSQASGPSWVIRDLLLEQTATLVSAQPHAMKSLSWLEACLEAVTFRSVWTEFNAPDVERTLFIETEDPAWLVEARIRGFAKGLRIDPNDLVPGFHYVCPGPFDLVAQENSLRDLLNKHSPNFAVISTLQNLLNGRSWLKQDEMQPVMAAIIRLSRLCCPLVLITHSPWDKKQRRAAGTVSQAANFVTALHYEKIQNRKTGETFAHVLVDSNAGAVQNDFHLKLTTEGDEADPESVRDIAYGGLGWPKGIGKAAVLAAIEDDSEASAKEIAERTGFGTRYVQQIMQERKADAKSRK